MGRKIKVKTRGGEVRPKRKKRMLAIILKRGKGTFWKWVKFSEDTFTIDGNTYFIVPEGAYLSNNKVVFSVYIEGVSTPLSHRNIEIKHEKRTYTDPISGEQKTIKVPVVNDLKFDSEIVDVLLNRKLADQFTKVKVDKLGVAVFILLIMAIFIGIGNLAMWFV